MRSTQSQNPASRRWHSETEVRGLLKKYRSSGLTQRVFAREAGIGVSTLQLWLRKTRTRADGTHAKKSVWRRKPAVEMLEVDLGAVLPQSGREGYEIELRNGN